jgi:putative membrane protein
MYKYLIPALGALALAACGQQATTESQTSTTAETNQPEMAQPAAMTDAEFVQAAANSDAYEIQSSELAAQRAARADVKEFATMMIRDHRATTQELTALAPQLNMAAPTPQLASAETNDLNRLRGLSGEAFDDAYLDEQVEAHEAAVNTFERYIQGSSPGPLRDWAQTTLPKLRTHLEHVQRLENAT